MSDEELIDVFDEDGKLIDTISRTEAERLNHITENVLIFVFDSQGRVWAQLRARTKNHFPLIWDISAAGAVSSGEDKLLAAERETLEETGLKVKLHLVDTFLNEFHVDDGQVWRRLSSLYIGVNDEQPTVNDEVEDFKLWATDELEADIEQHPEQYVPSFAKELKMAWEAYQQIFKSGKTKS